MLITKPDWNGKESNPNGNVTIGEGNVIREYTVHCINSSFAVMIELTGVAKGKRFFHTGIAHTYYKPDIVKTVFTDWTFL
tara:strand:+ start:2740 stop:2979 length:240 start_codon:yes stop_codon:yes gene_type:complete